MMLTKYLVLIGRTFIATFFIVNLFNIIPLDLNNNAWLTQVSMLTVDTASLLLLGLVCMKINSVYLIKDFSQASSEISDQESNLMIRERKNIGIINKISRYLMIFFIILAFCQSYIFFNGLKQINNKYSVSYENINKKYNLQKNKFEDNLINNDLNYKNIKKDKLRTLEIKKNRYILDLNKDVSKARFLLLRGNIKVFIMSFIWVYGLFKLSRFKTKE